MSTDRRGVFFILEFSNRDYKYNSLEICSTHYGFKIQNELACSLFILEGAEQKPEWAKPIGP